MASISPASCTVSSPYSIHLSSLCSHFHSPSFRIPCPKPRHRSHAAYSAIQLSPVLSLHHQPLQPLLPSDYSHSVDYPNLLRSAARYVDVELAQAVHASILKLQDGDINYLFNALIVAYVKLGRLNDAYKVLLYFPFPDVFSYTAVISCFAKSRREAEAVILFVRMMESDIEPNEYSYVAILTACIRTLDLELGLQVHALAVKLSYLDSLFVPNALMGLYSKCGARNLVLEVFDGMHKRDITSWNTVISDAVKVSMYNRAFDLFRGMIRFDCFRADQFTMSALLAASAGCLAYLKGREIHAHALKSGFECNLSVNNALIAFYTKCGSLENVVALFEKASNKDVITWTGMIVAYMEFGLVDLAMSVFRQMPERNCISYNALLDGLFRNGEPSRALSLFVIMLGEGAELTDSSLTSIICACGLLAEPKTSFQIHGFVLKFGYGSNFHIESALINMYVKSGRMADAQKLLGHWTFQEDDPVIWTTMIHGYAREAKPEVAISLFHLKHTEGCIVIDKIMSSAVLEICGTLGYLELGEQIHCHALKSGFLPDLALGNGLVSMYAKSMDMDNAIKVFDAMPTKDTVSWNCLLTGLLLHRLGNEALDVWSRMQNVGMVPDVVTFFLIISAYRHTNLDLVYLCRRLFNSMKDVYNIKPSSQHYAAFVRVLGFWGYLKEAEELIGSIPFGIEAPVWKALLDNCRASLNTDLGKLATKQILALQPQDPSTYILVSNLYSASGLWHCSERVREEMREKGFRKHPSRSWIIHENKVHSFYARDKSHLQTKDIYSGLEILILECMKVGYVPDTSFVLHEVEEYQKKDFLFYHSAKLAVTYGVLMTRPGRPIRVVKNVLLCGDCHTFFKYVSKVTQREIFTRDGSGFHCFRNGQCSCKDCWQLY